MKTFWFALIAALFASHALAIPLKEVKEESNSGDLFNPFYGYRHSHHHHLPYYMREFAASNALSGRDSNVDPKRGTTTTTTITTGGANDETYALAARGVETEGLQSYGHPKYKKHWHHHKSRDRIPDNNVLLIPDSQKIPDTQEVPTETPTPNNSDVLLIPDSEQIPDTQEAPTPDNADQQDNTPDSTDTGSGEDTSGADVDDTDDTDTDDDTDDDGNDDFEDPVLGHRGEEDQSLQSYGHPGKNHGWHKHKHHHYRAVENTEAEQTDSYFIPHRHRYRRPIY